MRTLPLVAAATTAVATALLLAPTAHAAPDRVGFAGFLAETTLAQPTTVEGTTVGGLSGIDFDPRAGRFYLISDDRSQSQAARFYTADLRLVVDGAEATLDRVEVATDPLLRPDGSTFPALGVDPEAIRVDPRNGTFYWTSEGERIVPADGSAPTLVDPFLRQSRADGRFVRELGLPANERVTAGPQGLRQNAVLEGLALSTDGRSLVTAMEGPLLQDGPSATTTAGALTRLTVVDKASGRPTRQLAYPAEPVFAAPVPATAFATTGVVDVLAVDASRYLVMERSFSTGVGNRVRIYEIDTRGATDVLALDSLAEQPVTPVGKRMVLDLADLPLHGDGSRSCADGGCVDNVEGMTFGPTLADGRRTLVMVSDDNFTASQRTQVLTVAVTVR